LASPDVLAALAKTPLAGITTLAFIGFDIVAKGTVSATVVNVTVHGIVWSSLLTCHFANLPNEKAQCRLGLLGLSPVSLEEPLVSKILLPRRRKWTKKRDTKLLHIAAI